VGFPKRESYNGSNGARGWKESSVAIEFACACGRKHSADESMAGRTIACDGCGLEVKVPQAGGAVGDLVSQMRAVQAQRAVPAESAAQAARAIAGAGTARPRTVKAPLDAHARAAHHLGIKKKLWAPALGVGIVCFLAGAYAFGLALQSAMTRSPFEIRQGKFGAVFTDERGDERELVFAPDGRPWLIEKDAERLEWDGNKPRPMAGEFTLKVIPADTDPRALQFAKDVRESQHTGFGNLLFGGAFMVLGPLLVVLSLWMRRDVRLVASRAKAEADAGA